MEKKWIQINPNDNCAVALEKLQAETVIELPEETLILKEDIPQGHKFSLKKIEKGDPVLKYGQPIGEAVSEIEEGVWIHTHNMKTRLSDELEYEYHPDIHPLNAQSPETFMGYERKTAKPESAMKSGSFRQSDASTTRLPP